MDRHEVTTQLIQKFTSGNSLQIHRAYITREEFNAIYIAMRDFGVAEAKLARVEALASEFRHSRPIEFLSAWERDFREALGEKEVG